nr:MAG: hypothetical protein [Bacteriophage sp.]
MFNRRLLIDSGGEQQTYSALEIHVDTPDGGHVRSARVELTYNGESNLANTDNKGIAVFYGVPTGTEISYTITAAGYNAATGKWIIPTDVEYETEYVILSYVILPPPPLPTKETVLWKGSTVNAFTITIPPGVKVLKITTESTYVNEFVDPNLPRYIGVTGGKTYNIRWVTVEEGSIPEPEYWEVQVYRYNSSYDFKQWVSSYAGDAIEGAITTSIQIIMSYSASINGVTPNVLDY